MSNSLTADDALKATPAVALVRATIRGEYGRYSPLQLEGKQSTATVYLLRPSAEDEISLGSYVAEVRSVGSLDEDGIPLGPSQKRTFHPAKLFEAHGTITITERRLIGIGDRGESLLGPVTGEGGTWLYFSLPLEEIAAIVLMRTKGLLGKPKDGGIKLQLVGVHGAMLIRIIGQVSAGATRVPVSDVMAKLVEAACTLRIQGKPDLSERKRLEAVRDGARTTEGTDSVAWLQDPQRPPDLEAIDSFTS